MLPEDKKELSFEDALFQLEQLVKELEAGKIKLDDAVSSYEQATKLKNFCERKLQEAKLKIEKVEISIDGELTLTDLDNKDGSN